jgi:hypothetical protein
MMTWLFSNQHNKNAEAAFDLEGNFIYENQMSWEDTT